MLVYSPSMKKIAIRRLLSFLLACVLLAQTAVGVAGWHIDFPHPEQDTLAAHCALMEQDTLGEHHHQCCHTTSGSIAVPAASLALPQTESVTLIITFSAEPYCNPLADLLIRPPIA